MAVTKSSLMDSICATTDFAKQESSAVVESLLEIIKRTLESGEEVLISGFGKFCLKDKRERKGRNPQTGDDMMMDARRIVTFKCSEKLRKKLNNKAS
ncbi:MAG: integration host factor subunit alpha [Deltaproteobacteria bacterium]|jgi:integration host factor subunit alpha|nr:integration host factor subunit alpha [Deltaproteobacteria bacterium]